ncbi:relaxin receptor 1 [Anolis carolinensis]|uniref:relaxin receptor 1 n=1 Tax=Anolis carolinensis TaxID=28377 RepID=UPI002F2B860C
MIHKVPSNSVILLFCHWKAQHPLHLTSCTSFPSIMGCASCLIVNYIGWPVLLSKMLSRNGTKDKNGEKKTTPNCTLSWYPEGCVCSRTSLRCQAQDFLAVPQGLSNVTELDLNQNKISSLLDYQFIDNKGLEYLFLKDNGIQTISKTAFSGLSKLRRLYLSSNSITDLELGVFQDLQNLKWLILDNNRLAQIFPSVFMGLKSLVFLDLRGNFLQEMPGASICAETPKLNWLDLEGNHIRSLQRSDFRGCGEITVLVLTRNKIERIQEGAFSELKKLVELDLSSNRLKELLPSSFQGLHELQQLNLSNNPLHRIYSDQFDHVSQLRSLSLEGIEIPNIQNRMFEQLTNLSHIYFMRFSSCRFAPHVRSCKPNTDGISSFENLLASAVLRAAVWVIAFVTCFGNLFVIFTRSFIVTEHSKHTMAIKSLCCADCLMGAYLFFLGAFDLKFSGEYNRHAQAWMSSPSCHLVGSLAVLSAEVSVLLLTYMTLEKYLCIAFPFGRYGASERRTRLSLALLWLLGLSLTLLPFSCKEAFGVYYGSNGVCFPLQSHPNESPGARGYSTGIFLGLNLVAFLLVSFAYGGMFHSIHATAARAAEQSILSVEVALAKRFFFIVFTNALCWIPIFILKLLSLLDVDIPGTVTSWVVVFILPINSTLNPILYTLTAPSFQEKLKQFLQKKRASLQETQAKSLVLLSLQTSTTTA